MSHATLVDAAWVQRRLDQLRVFDATYFLSGDPRDAGSEFLRQHLPGARRFDIDSFADVESTLPHMVPSQAVAQRMLRSLGLSNHDQVVFYDQGGMQSAARGWWTLRLFGHDRVYVLDGGLPAWLRDARSVVLGESAPAPAGTFTASLRARLLRGLGDVLDNLTSQRELVVDARPAGRFRGEAPEPRAGVRGGHIPGSINVPSTGLLAADGTLLPASQLRDLFSAAGVDGTRAVITSCGSGVTASLLALGLEVAGLGEAAVYDGSWTEWGSRSDTPVATG